MKPAPFEYFRPRSMDEALDLLAAHGPDAKPLAGGQSLIPAMNFRLATPAVLVDLNEIAGLSNVTSGDGFLRVGAMARHRTLERSEMVAARGAARRRRDAVRRARRDSHARDARRQPRARGSGRRAAGRDARARRGLHAAKRPGLADGLRHRLLHRAVLHALEPGELLTEVAIPRRPPRSAHAFEEMARRHGDYALAGAAASVAIDERGRCTTARIALFSVGDRPVLAEHARRALAGERPTSDTIRGAADAAAAHDIDPPGDIHASSAYRRHLAAVLTRRVLERAFHSLETP